MFLPKKLHTRYACAFLIRISRKKMILLLFVLSIKITTRKDTQPACGILRSYYTASRSYSIRKTWKLWFLFNLGHFCSSASFLLLGLQLNASTHLNKTEHTYFNKYVATGHILVYNAVFFPHVWHKDQKQHASYQVSREKNIHETLNNSKKIVRQHSICRVALSCVVSSAMCRVFRSTHKN